MRLRSSKKLILIAFVCLIVLVVAQALIFHYFFFFKENAVQKADVVVVFDGAAHRIAEGIRLVNSQAAPVIIISPATAAQLSAYRRKYAMAGTAKAVLEPRAATTYENAYYTARLIRQWGFHSVILVTSDYHMPRAYLLLRMMTAGESVNLQRASADDPLTGTAAWSVRWLKEKMLYNEMVQFWGSFFELIYHRVFGKTVPTGIRHSNTITRLEQLLLTK